MGGQKYFNHHATRVAIEVNVELDEETQWVGTGFFIEASARLQEGPKIDCLLLISNKHVLAEGAGRQMISLNKQDENGNIMFGQQESIEINHSTNRYVGHKDNEIDLACLDMRGLLTTKEYDVPILASGFLQELEYEKFGVGSEVLYSGYPNEMKDKLNGLALMRRGSIASIPTMDCVGKGLIAIDGTVLPGNSGGPAFVPYEEQYRLLGVMQSRSVIADDYGFVIKQKYVKEIIDDAVKKSADELRMVADSRILERIENVNGGYQVQNARKQVWLDITQELDQARGQGTS